MCFPLFHCCFYSEKYWTQMQLVTFWSEMIALLLGLPLLRQYVRYVLTSLVFNASDFTHKQAIMDVIDAYLPPLPFYADTGACFFGGLGIVACASAAQAAER